MKWKLKMLSQETEGDSEKICRYLFNQLELMNNSGEKLGFVRFLVQIDGKHEEDEKKRNKDNLQKQK